MSMNTKQSGANAFEKPSLFDEQQEKINEVRRLLGELPEKSSIYCSDASISRYLTARNWNVKKATKMLKDTLKWRLQYKPEEIRWLWIWKTEKNVYALNDIILNNPTMVETYDSGPEPIISLLIASNLKEEVAHEAETGKIYRSNYTDKYGRSVLVMRPGFQNTKSTKGQIRYFVYCMENAILNLPPEHEQMVWLIDFRGYNLSHISVKVTRETAHVLQEHYPERLGLAILYNPPKFFEPFYMMVKPFLEPKTYRKVKFVYSDDLSTKKIMEDLFDMEKLDNSFGGLSTNGFNIDDYAEMMKEDDKRMPLFWTRQNLPVSSAPPMMAVTSIDGGELKSASDDSNEEHEKNSSLNGLSATEMQKQI